MKSPSLLSVLVVLILGFACTHVLGQSDQEDVAVQDPLEKLVDGARSDLAQRLSIAEDDIEIVSARRVTWRDSSLGCPEKGTIYMQALQPGVLIELRVEETIYPYHSTPEGPAFYCKTPSSVEPLPTPDEASTE